MTKNIIYGYDDFVDYMDKEYYKTIIMKTHETGQNENIITDEEDPVITDGIEETDESSKITEPYDPNKIKIDTQQITLYHIIDRLKNNEINLYTEFQRRPDLWDDTKQSRLIESILLRLPIPSFYFDGKNDNKWDVVDGLQRVYTIKKFIIDRQLKLKDLQFLTQFEEFFYKDLPRDLHRRIDQFPIVVSVIQPGTPDEVKFNLFSRINTGGLILSPQEIRHALNQGIPADFVKELAESQDFISATCGTIKPDRMLDRYFITRFISFYLDYQNYEPDLETFLNRGMAAIRKLSRQKRLVIRKRFLQAMQLAIKIFDNDAFRKRKNKDDPRKRINKALFEVISVQFARLAEEDCKKLVIHKENFKLELIELMNNQDFTNSISYGTAFKDAVEKRHSDIEEIIQKTVGSKN